MSDSATSWMIAHQAPLSMGFSRQDTGVGCCALLQGILPTQGLSPHLLHLHALAGRLFTTSTTWKAYININMYIYIYIYIYTHTHKADSLCCTANQLYSNLKKLVKIWRKKSTIPKKNKWIKIYWINKLIENVECILKAII